MKKIHWLLGAVLTVLLTASLHNSYGAFTSTINNNTNTSATGIFSCQTLVRNAATRVAYPFSETSGTVANDVSGIDTTRGGIYNGTITYNQASVCGKDPGGAVLLNGTNAYISGPNLNVTTANFSSQVWFRTNTTTGGKIMSTGASRQGASATQDRNVYMTNSGQIVFAVNAGGTVRSIITPLSYNDNQYHQVVATMAPANQANPGMRLYIDGQLIVSNSAVVTTSTTSMFIRVGYDAFSGSTWPNVPTSAYFRGNVAWYSFYNDALTPAEISEMHSVGRLPAS